MRLKLLLPLFLSGASIGAQAQNESPYWSLSGNNNATPASRLGTTKYTALNLTTNNVPRIYIAPNGFVGIGTSSPTSQLHVEGQTLLNIFVNTVAPGLQSGSGLIGYMKAQPTAAGQRLGYFLTGSQGGGTNPYNATGMVGYADGPWSNTSRPAYIAFETTKTGTMQRAEAMRITSDGKVSIGIAGPLARLHVADSNTAIYAQGLGAGSNYGVYAASGYYGVYGSGTIGLYGIGSTDGVSGTGHFGLYGLCSTAYGDAVHGYADQTGAYGGNFYSLQSYGIYASTSTGAYAAYFQGPVYTSGTYQGSDKRLKKNISEFTDAVSIIRKLKPKTYEYLTDGKMANMNLPKGKHYGLIAQDLETVLPDLVKETDQYPGHPNDSSGRNNQSSSNVSKQTFKAVNYTELIPILVKGMQEQDAEKEDLKTEVQTLKETVQVLKADLQELKAMLSNNLTGSLSSAFLEVPVPNPAKGSTNIRYSIPAGTASARLTVVNMLGQVMKEVKLSGGAGQVTLDVSNLSAGTYPCTLWVNGQQAGSKQLVIAH